MDHRQLGRIGATALAPTRLGLGGAPVGNLGTVVSDADAQATYEAAWAAGIRFFDTAPWYGLGLSEHRVGTFLRGKPRSDYIVSTKVGRLLRPWPSRLGPRINRGPWLDPPDFEVRFDYSYDGVIRAHEDSLQRLGLPSVDILLVHDLDRGYHSPEAAYQARVHQLVNGGFAALRDLRADGRIGAIGMGVNMVGVMSEFLDLFRPDLFLVAGPYTLIDQSSLDAELARCVDEGVSVVIGAAFASGLLAAPASGGRARSTAGHSAETLERARRIQAVCARAGVGVGALALQLPSAHPAVASLVFGAVSAGEVDQAIASFTTPVPEHVWSELKAEGLLAERAPVPTG